ncbi:hypothetical protein EMIT0194P_110112 [Pseudomonas serbica]
MLRAAFEEQVRINAVLSHSFSAKLELPRPPVHEVIVDTPHIVQVMQEQARKQAEDAKRPQWKRWSFWNKLAVVVAGSVTFVLGVLTYFKTFGW